MINSEKFKDVFGLYATELWAMPNEDFVKWINAEYKETKLEPSPHPEREKTKRVIKGYGTNDLISRLAAIDAIAARADRCAENFSTDDPFGEGLVIAKSIVKGLPPVQAATPVRPERKENDWNLCSDRLPEKEGCYLITVDEYDRKDVNADFFYFRNDGTPSWHYEKNVIAWMPFPEPYRGEQE